ncbi:hypothetical protein GIB67_024258 [Kingdonia uniflora]|uniref:Uncharacterized protein n=1 Tax=Kingdonia uniflora TaxID=39325 RepID=A0A7J7LZN7_9MAGN|nr:hypothetical protein GIB67_024258 [Kingdonia uniflora]
MKYVDDDEGIKIYFAAFHSQKEFPVALWSMISESFSMTGRQVVSTRVSLSKGVKYENHQVGSQAVKLSLAISSRLLQVPYPQQTMLGTDDAMENIASTTPPAASSDIASATDGITQVLIKEEPATSSVQSYCDGCSTVPSAQILIYVRHAIKYY